MDLKGKTAVVTGGAVRVGRALTLALAAAGCDVMIHYGRSEEEAESARAAATAHGVYAITHSADLTDAADTARVIPTAVAALGRVDILINNAAIFPEGDDFDSTDVAAWDRINAINLRAPFMLSQAFGAALRDNPRPYAGKIINLLDARIFKTGTDHFVYRLTKAGLWHMTRQAALALAPHATVDAVALGAILPPPGEDDAYLQQMAEEQVPLRRAGSPEIVAANIIHLLKQDFLTGVTIPIDGAQFL